jgi:hypothetical protein
MRRVLLMVLSLAGAGPAFATDVDDIPCPAYSLSRTHVRQLHALVRKATGLPLESRKPYVCQQGALLFALVTTQRETDPEGAGRWYEGQCESSRRRLPRWRCEYSAQRIVRFGGFEREGEAEVVVPLTSDALLIRQRLKEAFTLSGTLAEGNSCESGPETAQQLLEVRSDLAFPWNVFQVAVDGERFTLWTTRHAIHFTADGADQPLQLRCWRPKKSPLECTSSRCPA